jgi:hypothetical protein
MMHRNLLVTPNTTIKDLFQQAKKDFIALDYLGMGNSD